MTYEIIGNLDADLSFEPDLFEMLMRKFAANPRLGVGGAPFTEGNGTYDFRFSSIEHVSGRVPDVPARMLRRDRGIPPMKGGGIDVLAVLTARMKGWQTRSFRSGCASIIASWARPGKARCGSVTGSAKRITCSAGIRSGSCSARSTRCGARR